jgi:hypothetical protein
MGRGRWVADYHLTSSHHFRCLLKRIISPRAIHGENPCHFLTCLASQKICPFYQILIKAVDDRTKTRVFHHPEGSEVWCGTLADRPLSGVRQRAAIVPQVLLPTLAFLPAHSCLFVHEFRQET